MKSNKKINKKLNLKNKTKQKKLSNRLDRCCFLVENTQLHVQTVIPYIPALKSIIRNVELG